MPATAPAIPSSRHWTRWILRLLLIALAIGFVVAIANSEPETPTKTADPPIEVQFPGPGDLDVRQAKVGIDLTGEYTLDSLFVDRIQIPEDQVERIAALNQALFSPGPGTATGALAPGRHCARARFYRTTESANTARTTAWCFQLH